jgi:hypothetical protein
MLSVSLDSVPPFSDSVVGLEGEFQRLLARWRLEAAVVPASEFPSFFDERGILHTFDILAKPTQTSLLRVDRLDPERGAALLRELASVTNRLGPVEASFLRQVVRAEDDQRRQWTPKWRSVRQSFGMAVTLMIRDASSLVEDLWQQGLGRHWGGGPNYRGAAHFLRPLEQLALALQLWVTRPQDLERIREASVSRTVAALRSGTLPRRESRPDWFPGNPSRRPWWRRVLDRPAVWRSIEALPDPYTLDACRRHWLQYLESCRLTLALRLFRDRHGAWPDRLEELVPAVMSNLPVDPVTGEPFRYVRTGNRWRLRDPYGAVLAETDAGLPPARR